jgi:malate dehydrogenase
MYSYPVTCANGRYEIVRDLSIDDFGREKMRTTERELREERASIEDLLGQN